MRPFAAQCRFVPPCVDGYDLSGAFQTRVTFPFDASAVQIDQRRLCRTSNESGAPPRPGVRTNAIRFPSGDQRGDASTDDDGDNHSIDVESLSYTPMNA